MAYSDPIPLEVAHRIVAEVSAVAGVASLHPGDFGETALLFPGERVHGLRLREDRLEVHVVVDLSTLPPRTDLQSFAEIVRLAVTPLSDFLVDVVLADATYHSAAADTANISDAATGHTAPQE